LSFTLFNKQPRTQLGVTYFISIWRCCCRSSQW